MACFSCKQPGHWARDCPSRSPTKSENNSSSADEGDIPVIYCDCGAGPCIVRTSSSDTNPNRKYFWCPKKKYDAKNACNFFKWCDEVKSPQCPCGAGACSIQKVTSGTNKGRQYFACRIKKGHGACNFLQWIDPQGNIVMDSNADTKNSKSRFVPTRSLEANAVSESRKPSFTSFGSQISNAASKSCNGSALHICDPIIADTDQFQHSSDFISAAKPLYEERTLPVENREFHGMSSIFTPTSPNDPSEVVDTSNVNKADSSNISTPQSLWGSQPATDSEIHDFRTNFENFDVRTPSIEAQSPLLWPDSYGFGSQSSDNVRCAKSLESDVSRSPENRGESFCTCNNHRSSNYRHYQGMDEKIASMLMHIKQENNELKSEIKSLRKQVATYAEKEKVSVPKCQQKKMVGIEIGRYKAKESLCKSWLKWGFGLMMLAVKWGLALMMLAAFLLFCLD